MNFKNLFKTLLFVITIMIGQSSFARCVVCYRVYGEWHCYYCEDKNCGADVQANEGMSLATGRYCEQYMILPNKPPIIRTDKNGSAFLDNNGRIIKIASDKAIIFFGNSTKKTNKEILAFYKSDDGIVSQKRVNAIAKDLNATIVKSKKPIKATYCPACKEENDVKLKSEMNNKKVVSKKKQNKSTLAKEKK